MKRFEGFADADARFFKALARHQKREWFLAHKAEFEVGWQEPMKLLMAELRERIDPAYPHLDLDDPKAFRILARLEKKGYSAASHDTLKRTPKEFDPEHPRADLLRRKGLVVMFPSFAKKLLTSRKLVETLVAGAKDVAPLVEWLAVNTA